MGISAGYAAAEKAASEEVGKVDWKSLTGGDKIAEIRKQFEAIGSAAGKEATAVQLKSSIAAKIDMVHGEVNNISVVSKTLLVDPFRTT